MSQVSAEQWNLLRMQLRADVQSSVSGAVNDAFKNEIRAVVRDEVQIQLKPVRDTIGEINDDGTGGSGLSGHLARTMTKVDSLFVYRNIGVGLVMAVTMFSGLLFLGVKAWFVGLFHHDPTLGD